MKHRPDFRLPEPCSQFFDGGQDRGAVVCGKDSRRMGSAYDPADTVCSGNSCHFETMGPVLRTIVQTRQYMAMKVDHF